MKNHNQERDETTHENGQKPGAKFDWETAAQAIEKGELTPAEFVHLLNSGADHLESNDQLWVLAVKFWQKLDASMEPVKKVWNGISPERKRTLYALNPVKILVRGGILSATPEELETFKAIDAKEEKVQTVGFKIGSILQPELRPFMPVINTLLNLKDRGLLMCEQLGTELATHRVEKQRGANDDENNVEYDVAA